MTRIFGKVTLQLKQEIFDYLFYLIVII